MPGSPLIYLNGHLLPATYARISPLDYGFLYGFSVFETLRSYNGCLFRLPEHLARLRKGADSLGIPAVPDDSEIEKAVRQVLQGNNLKEARVRLTLSAGEGSSSADPASCGEPSLVIAAAAFVPPDEAAYHKGYRVIVSQYRRDSRSPLSGIKSGNYLSSLLARAAAREQGAEDAVLLNERGSLSECSTGNMFLVRNEGLITPDEKSGILPGITRREVLRLAPQVGLKVEEREVTPEEIFQADEAFITSSLLEIMPLTRVNGSTLGKGLRGAVTNKLQVAYSAAVSGEAV